MDIKRHEIWHTFGKVRHKKTGNIYVGDFPMVHEGVTDFFFIGKVLKENRIKNYIPGDYDILEKKKLKKVGNTNW